MKVHYDKFPPRGFRTNPATRTDKTTDAWQMDGDRGGMGTLGIAWAIIWVYLRLQPLNFFFVVRLLFY